MRAASQRCEATCDLRTKHWSKMKHTSLPSVSIDAYMKGFCHILPCLARPCTYAELRATHSHTVTWSRTVAVAVTVAVATTTAATATATAAQAPCLVLSHSSLFNACEPDASETDATANFSLSLTYLHQCLRPVMIQHDLIPWRRPRHSMESVYASHSMLVIPNLATKLLRLRASPPLQS